MLALKALQFNYSPGRVFFSFGEQRQVAFMCSRARRKTVGGLWGSLACRRTATFSGSRGGGGGGGGGEAQVSMWGVLNYVTHSFENTCTLLKFKHEAHTLA